MAEWLREAVEPNLIEVTLSCDTVEYAQNDLLADTQAISGAVYAMGGSAVLTSLALIDKDDNGRAIDLIILEDTATVGTENAAFALTDAQTAKVQAIVSMGTADYTDMGSAQFANKDLNDLGVIVRATEGSTDLGIAAVYRDATGDTYTASGLVVQVGLTSN